MAIRVTCPACRIVLQVEKSQLGARVKCGNCDAVFTASVDEFRDGDLYGLDRGNENSGKALAALILGCVSLVAWCLPILGLPVSITGLVLGIKGIGSRSHGLAVAGVVLCVIGLMLSTANAAVGAYLGATGQHPLFQHR
jgi:predicted Zn finger-like uncharacterized protein